jgi:hypothetical protein
MATRQQRRHPDRHRPTDVVCVGYISPGAVDTQFCGSLVATLMHDAATDRHLIGGGHINLESGPRIVEARTQVVDAFVRSPVLQHCNWLWLIDADMSWEAEALHQLVTVAHDTEADVVGGLCFAGGHSERMYPTIYRATTDAEGWSGVEPVTDYPRDAPITVAATGAAFLLVSRRLLLHMLAAFGKHPETGALNAHPWFVEGTNPAGHTFGEDVAFCQRARALGAKVVVDPRIKVDHYKRRPLNEALWDTLRVNTPTPDDYAETARTDHGVTAQVT